MRLAALVIVGSSISAAGVLFACSKAGEDDNGGAKDASAETALLGDTGAPDLDSGVPLGDPCGDVGGLQPNAPWPMMGGCPKRSGYAGREGAQNAMARFVTPIPAAASSPAVSAEGYLWVGTTAGDVVALSAFYGSMLVSVHVAAGSDPVSSSPALDKGGRAVVGSTDGHVYVLDVGGASLPIDAGDDADASDADAGIRPAHVAATYDVGGPVTSGPAIMHDGTIVVATANGKAVAVKADGAIAWSVTTGGSGKASPAIGKDGAIVTMGGDGSLYALAPADGARTWSYAVGADAAGIAVGGDDTIYVGAVDGKVHAVSPDGKPKWTFTAGGPITAAPAVAASLLYASSSDKKLYALDSQTGTKKWEFATLGAAAGPVVSNAGVAYFGSADGKLYAVNPSGLLFFAANVKGAVRAPPAVGYDGTMIVTTENGIAAIGP